MTSAGRYRHRISIRRPVEVRDGKGGYRTEWTTLAEPRAEVTGLDGRESTIEHVLQGISVFRFRVRWRADLAQGLKPSDQVRHAGRDLNIRSATDPDGKRRDLVIVADSAGARAAD